jgi:tetratricopeptide (TPR) repeat protein
MVSGHAARARNSTEVPAAASIARISSRELSEANFGQRNHECGCGKVLFTINRTWWDRAHPQEVQSMTATALAVRLPDAGTPDSFIARQLRIGLEYYTAGRIDEAIAAYQYGLAAVAHESSDCVPAATVSELHSRLGNVCLLRGDLELAAEHYKAALRLAPHLTSCWCNLGNVRLKSASLRRPSRFIFRR